MEIYKEFEMLTFGNVPTVKVDVPVPVPFIPNWTKWVLGLLGAVTLGFIVKTFFDKQSKKENAKLIESLNDKNAQQEKAILEQAQLISEYESTYKLKPKSI